MKTKLAKVWSQPNCMYCDMVSNLLLKHGYTVMTMKLGSGYTKEDLLEAVPNARTVPQVFIDDEYIGSYDKVRVFLNDNA